MAHALLAQAPGDDVGSVLSLQDLRLREITRYNDCDSKLTVALPAFLHEINWHGGHVNSRCSIVASTQADGSITCALLLARLTAVRASFMLMSQSFQHAGDKTYVLHPGFHAGC